MALVQVNLGKTKVSDLNILVDSQEKNETSPHDIGKKLQHFCYVKSAELNSPTLFKFTNSFWLIRRIKSF